MELRILLLGTVELQSGDKRSLPGSRKELMALAALAWDASRAVSVDTLIHRIWDDRPPAKPRNALYVLITRIRKALAAIAGPQAPELTSRAQHYVLAIDPDTVDLRRYLALLDQSRSLADGDSDREALDVLCEAHRLWRGEPLSGLSGSWAEGLRGHVEKKKAAAARTQATIHLRLGDYAEAADILQPIARQHRTDESVAGNLALALHGSGRTAEATQVLQLTRQHVLRESGSDPGEEFQRIHHGILAHTPLRALLPARTAPVNGAAGAPEPDTLPPDTTWVGRKAELARLIAVLGDSSSTHAAVLSGMPGCGKSALAVHLAHQLRDAFPDGRIFLDLRSHTPFQSPMSPTEALQKLLPLLGIPREELPEGLDSLVSLWRTTVRHRRFVAILDDAAHPDQIRPLIPGASPALIIVTSRQRLTGLPGVHSVAMDVLPRADALALVQHMMGERAPSPTEAASLARLCDRLPLAITLVTSRLLAHPSWSVANLLESLEQSSSRLPEIRDGHANIAHAFHLSYRSLTGVQQLVFRRIGLHMGSEFDPGSIAALAGLTLDETNRALEDLLTHHLISEPTPHRYRAHDLVRAYARTLAEDDPEAGNQESLHRLFEHYLRAADQADRQAFPHRQRITLPGGPTRQPGSHMDPHQWFTVEGPNVLAVLAYVSTNGTPRQLALFAHTLAGFLDSEGYLATAITHLEPAVTHWAGSGDSSAHGCALIDLSAALSHAGEYDEAIRAARRALSLAGEGRDHDLRAEALHQLSICYWYTSRHKKALQYQQSALDIRLAKGDLLQQGRSFNIMGMICLHLEQHKQSLKYFLAGLARFRDVRDHRGEFIALNNLAELYKTVGKPEDSIIAYRQAMRVSQTLGSKGQYTILQINLASTLYASGKPENALELYIEALPALRSMGDQRSEAITCHRIGQTLHALGKSEKAIPHHMAALSIARRIHAAQEECQALRGLALAEYATGRHELARTHLRASLAISREIDARVEEAETLQILERMDDEHDL